MITIFTDDYNTISQNSYDTMISSLQIHQLKCSCGHCASLVRHGSYFRTVRTSIDPVRIRITRLKCSICGRTHAVLPASLVPYSQIPLHVQKSILQIYEDTGRQSDAASVCLEIPSVDENDIGHLSRVYRKCWLQKLKAAFLDISDEIGSLVKASFSLYSAQFMQIHKGVNLLHVIPT